MEALFWGSPKTKVKVNVNGGTTLRELNDDVNTVAMGQEATGNFANVPEHTMGNLGWREGGHEMFEGPASPIPYAAKQIYPNTSLILFWSCNDAFQRNKHGNLTCKVKEKLDSEDHDNLERTIALLKCFPNHMIIGCGNAQMWKLSPDFDVFAREMLDEMRENSVDVINPIDV